MPNPHKKQDEKDFDGFYVRWIGHKNLPSHIVCRACAKTKPAADYRYPVTKARSKAWGKAGNVQYVATSKKCAECRGDKKRTPTTALPPAVLAKRVASGDITPLKAAEIMRKRHAKASGARRAGQEKRWLDQYKARWAYALTGLNTELEFIRHAVANYRFLPPEHKFPEHHFYISKYREILLDIKAKIKFEFDRPKMADRMPALTSWQPLLSDEKRAALKRLHNAAGDARLHAAYPRKEWRWMNFGK